MNESVWTLELEISGDNTDLFMENLEEVADSTTCFELDDKGVRWKMVAYCEFEDDIYLVENEVKKTFESLSLEPQYKIEQIENIDWVAESQKDFPPVDAGRFFVHASWRDDEVPDDKIKIEIDPHRAFGTGQHETTKGCLLTIDAIANEGLEFSNILDMGCGSGILAIAAAKIWQNANITAVDNDPVCVDTTVENFKINKISNQQNIALSDGYSSEVVKNNAPYDLIISNILALPLIEFSEHLANSLKDNGHAVLAGLMCQQADSVINAHVKYGLKLQNKTELGQWCILHMVK